MSNENILKALAELGDGDGAYEHDAICGRYGCKGKIESHARDEGDCCSCHISPPCGFCVEPGFYCDTCSFDEYEERRQEDEAKKLQNKLAAMDLRLRKMDDKYELLVQRIEALKAGKPFEPVEELRRERVGRYWNYYNKYGEHVRYEPIKLDNTKIDFFSEMHSSCSMIKEGVYPEGTTSEEVRKKVDGTFGGRFESFGNGRFKFIAYTD